MRLAAIGRPSEVGGLALAGALVLPARSADEAREAWAALPPDVGVVVLAPESARAVARERVREGAPLSVVMPG